MPTSTASQKKPKDLELAEEVAKYYYDPLGWVMFAFPWTEDKSLQVVKLQEPWASRYNSKYGPDVWACEFLDKLGRDVRERRFNGRDAVRPIRKAVASGHGIGKSAMTGWLVSWIMSTRPNAQGTVTANTGTQLETKTWAQITKWVKMSITRHWFEVKGSRGSMKMYRKGKPEKWFCTGQTCREENSESFAGQHAADSTSFYINDEASSIPDVVWEVEEGGLSDGEPMIFAFGNPTRNDGKFRELFGRLKHRWDAVHIDSREVQITNKEKIAEDIEDYGEDSDFVRVRIRGVFPRAGSTQLIDSEKVKAAMGRELPDDDGAAVIVGVDVARYGDDQSVIMCRAGREASRWPVRKYRGVSTMDLAARVVEYLDHLPLKVDAIMVDGGGVGGGVVDRLRQLGYNVFDVQFGSSADDKRKYRNKRTEIWCRMRDWIYEGGSIPDDPEMESDLVSPQYELDDNGAMQLEKKKDMKKRGLASPDIADALAVTFAHRVARKDMPMLARAARRPRAVAVTEYNVLG